MKIKRAKPSDMNQILEIIKSNSPNYPINHAKKEIKEMFSDSLIKPVYFVAEENKKIVGVGGFSRSWSDMEITNIFWINVLPEFQGKGIGKKIIEKIIREIGKLIKPGIKMIVLSSNKPKFWRRFGFKKLNKYDGDYWLMGKILR